MHGRIVDNLYAVYQHRTDGTVSVLELYRKVADGQPMQKVQLAELDVGELQHLADMMATEALTASPLALSLTVHGHNCAAVLGALGIMDAFRRRYGSWCIDESIENIKWSGITPSERDRQDVRCAIRVLNDCVQAPAGTINGGAWEALALINWNENSYPTDSRYERGT